MAQDLQRKLALLDLLASPQPNTVARVFQKLPTFYSTEDRKEESSKRMFERDKEQLAEMGFPVLAEVREGEETYRLDPPNPALPSSFALTPDEAQTILQVLQDPVLRSQLPDPSLTALAKLYELYSPLERGKAASTGPPPPSAAVTSKVLSAIDKGKALVIVYPQKSGEPTARVFSPWRLILKQGRQYLLAWCHRDKFEKMLSLARMGRVTLAEAPYHGEPSGFDPRRFALTQDYLPEGTHDWRVHLWVEKDEVWRLKQTARTAVTKRNNDGSCEALFGVSNPERFFRYLLTFGSKAEILDPPEAREAFRRFLKEGVV